MSRALVKVVLCVLGVIVAAATLAGEGRIPIWQYPTAINAPGKYVVTRNIYSGGGPNPIIDVLVPGVDIDLNGFTLDASGSPAPVINILDDIVDVVIRNGSLVGGAQSIERGTGAGTEGYRVVVEDVQTRSAHGSSIHLWAVREVVIRRVNVIEPAGHAIWIDRGGIGGFTNGMIEHCALRLDLESQDGIHLESGSSFAIRHNRIETPVNDGIHVIGSFGMLVGENTISDADVHGIHFESTNGGKIYNNVISRGEINGIFIDEGSSDNYLLDNLVRQSGWGGNPGPGSSGGSGILIDGFRNHLESNTVNESDGCGLHFNGSDNTFGRNMARANDPSGSFCSSAATCVVGIFPPDSCDNGAGNTSFGDNLIPSPF